MTHQFLSGEGAAGPFDGHSQAEQLAEGMAAQVQGEQGQCAEAEATVPTHLYHLGAGGRKEDLP